MALGSGIPDPGPGVKKASDPFPGSGSAALLDGSGSAMHVLILVALGCKIYGFMLIFRYHPPPPQHCVVALL